MRYRLDITPRHAVALDVVCVDCDRTILTVSASSVDADDVFGAMADHNLRRYHLTRDVAAELRTTHPEGSTP